MKRKIIGLTLTAAMLAATAQTTFAGYYLQSDPFENTGTQFKENTPVTYDGRKIWKLDGSDNYKYNDSGIVSENDTWFSGRGAYTNSNKTGLFDRGWLPNDENTQSIVLSTSIDDSISTYDDFKAAKYANATRKGADMCEWNGYLFVLMNAPNMDGDVFQITVNDQEPIYVTYDELEYGDDDYWAKFNYSVTEPGDYTITVAPMSVDSEPIMGAAETVSFTVLPKEIPNELKLTADYSSEIGQGTLSVTPKVTNNIGKGDVTGTPIAALYKDGVLVEAKSGAVQTVDDGAYQKALTSINLTVPADTDYSKYNVKVFLFESLNNIKPITNSVSYR